LLDTEKLFVKQKVDYLEALVSGAAGIAGYAIGGIAGGMATDLIGGLGETGNVYNLFTQNGGHFHVVEKSKRCSWDGCIPTGRACCRPNHELKLHIYHSASLRAKEIMLVDRPFKCAGCCCTCCDCCAQKATLYVAPEDGDVDEEGPPFAIVQQPICGGGCTPVLHLEDGMSGERLATLTGPCCCFGGNCCDHQFVVTRPGEGGDEEIGRVVKEKPQDFEQLVEQSITDADAFTMSVPKSESTKVKAAMMASLLLIDYMFFEDEGDCFCDPCTCACGYKCFDWYCCGCICPCGVKCGDRPVGYK